MTFPSFSAGISIGFSATQAASAEIIFKYIEAVASYFTAFKFSSLEPELNLIFYIIYYFVIIVVVFKNNLKFLIRI